VQQQVPQPCPKNPISGPSHQTVLKALAPHTYHFQHLKLPAGTVLPMSSDIPSFVKGFPGALVLASFIPGAQRDIFIKDEREACFPALQDVCALHVPVDSIPKHNAD